MQTSQPADDSVADAWRHISEQFLSQYYELLASSPREAESSLASVLALSNHRHDTVQACNVVFVTATLAFAQQEHFVPAQTGVLFNICQTLLAAAARSMSKVEAQHGASSERMYQSALLS